MAEVLSRVLDMQEDVRGIRVGNKYFKISQFADDTTLLRGNPREMKSALQAIQFWCDATGMRANVKKREHCIPNPIHEGQ